MALTVTTDLVTITDAEAGGAANWSDVTGGGASIQETDFAVQGTECRSRAVSGAAASRGMIYDNGANLDFSSGGAHANKLIYFWIATFAPGLIDNVATAPGLVIRIDTSVSPGTNYWEWDIMYSDLLASPGTEFFRVYALDPRAPPTRTQGSPSLTTLRHFGAVMDTNANSKGQNLAIDKITYGFGEIRVSGTATDATSGFQEMIDFDWGNTTNRTGVLVEKSSVTFCKGKLVIGSTATAATVFTGQDTVITWEPTWYYDGTRVRPTIGYDFSNNWTGRKTTGGSYFGVEIVGNGTGDTTTTFGAAVGASSGRSGPTLIGSDQIPTEFLLDAAAENTAIYGTTFDNFRKLDFSAGTSSDIMRSCTFKRCGSLDIGPVVGLNNNFIAGIGGGYTFLERFINFAATAAETLATADPITEWTDSLNGTDWSVPSATAGYVELLGGTTRTNLTILDDDKMGSDDHYAECIVRFPAAGAGQGTLGPVIACHLTNDDYFWMEVDLVNDQVELFRVNTGSATSIAGPTTFTMDEDEDYIVLLRRSGTTIEGFISGNSAADNFHTVKLSATDSAHTGASQRLVGLRGDALAGQTGATGERPRVRLFGAGPITDNLGAIILPPTANWDFENANFINCTRALSWDTTGTYTSTNITLSNNLVAAHNDSGGLVTGSFVGGSGVPANTELLGASTVTFTADVNITIKVVDGSNDPATNIEGAAVYVQDSTGPFNDNDQIMREFTNASGIATETFNYSGDLTVTVRVRKKGFNPVRQTQTITNTGLNITVTMTPDNNVE